jgi:hypothetical protein
LLIHFNIFQREKQGDNFEELSRVSKVRIKLRSGEKRPVLYGTQKAAEFYFLSSRTEMRDPRF